MCGNPLIGFARSFRLATLEDLKAINSALLFSPVFIILHFTLNYVLIIHVEGEEFQSAISNPI